MRGLAVVFLVLVAIFIAYNLVQEGSWTWAAR